MLSKPAPASALEVQAPTRYLAVAIFHLAESFRGEDHLHRILEEAQAIVSKTLESVPRPRRER
jgi:hypothetical protein